jgi:hypothetical protein
MPGMSVPPPWHHRDERGYLTGLTVQHMCLANTTPRPLPPVPSRRHGLCSCDLAVVAWHGPNPLLSATPAWRKTAGAMLWWKRRRGTHPERVRRSDIVTGSATVIQAWAPAAARPRRCRRLWFDADAARPPEGALGPSDHITAVSHKKPHSLRRAFPRRGGMVFPKTPARALRIPTLFRAPHRFPGLINSGAYASLRLPHPVLLSKFSHYTKFSSYFPLSRLFYENRLGNRQ